MSDSDANRSNTENSSCGGSGTGTDTGTSTSNSKTEEKAASQRMHPIETIGTKTQHSSLGGAAGGLGTNSIAVSGLTNREVFPLLEAIGSTDHSKVCNCDPSDGAGGQRRRRSSLEPSAAKKPIMSDRYSCSQNLKGLTINKLRFNSLGLYGRETEIETIKDVYIKSKSSRQLVLIDGPAGSGKTSLSNQSEKIIKICTAVCEQPAIYITGKFDQQLVIEPYAGISTACRRLCEQLLVLNNRERVDCCFEQLRHKLRAEMKDEAYILTRMIPNVLELLSPGESAPNDDPRNNFLDIGYKEAQIRFQLVFRKFIRTVSSFVHLVFALDDLQWADTASLNLIESLISDNELPHLLLVGNYRSEALRKKDEGLSKALNALEKKTEMSDFTITKIAIGGLTLDTVNQLLLDLLSAQPGTTESLAALVHRRTLGNPFFVVQYLRLLWEHGLLDFNLGTLAWTWDIEQIHLETTATSNVVDFIQEKLKRLPPEVSCMLPILASLGSTFQTFLFERIFGHFKQRFAITSTADMTSLEYATSVIDICLQEGLIEELDKQTYIWVHDKIQEASLSLIFEEELCSLQFHLGELLLQYLSEREMEDTIFIVVNLLNRGAPHLPSEFPQREQLAVLNLRAGKHAVASSSFALASNYFWSGIQLLPSDPWNNACYSLCLDLYSSAAETDYCLGDYERMHLCCDEVLAQKNRPLVDKQRVYNVLLDSLSARDCAKDASDLCISILAELGCRFPRHARKLYILSAIMHLKAMLKKYRSVDPTHLPRVRDESKRWVMELLFKLATFLYFNGSKLLVVAIVKALQKTFRYGVCEYSSPIFLFTATILTGILGDLNDGQEYGKQALRLLQEDAPASKKLEARAIFWAHAFVLHWNNPLENSRKPLLHGYEVAMSMGDIVTAMWCIYLYIWCHQATGGSLFALDSDVRMYAHQMRENQQLRQLINLSILWQGMLNLSARSEQTVKLEGEAMDFLGTVADMENISQTLPYRRQQVVLAFYFGEYELLTDLTQQFGEGYWEKSMPGMHNVCVMTCYSVIAYISMARTTGKRKYKKLAAKLVKKVRKWSKDGVSHGWIFLFYVFKMYIILMFLSCLLESKHCSF